MKNVTLAIDEDVLAAARKYAAQHNTTVNGLVRDYLTKLAAFEDRAATARRRMVELSEQAKNRTSQWTWNREKIYDRSVFPGYEHSDLCGFAEDGGGSQKKDGGGSD